MISSIKKENLVLVVLTIIIFSLMMRRATPYAQDPRQPSQHTFQSSSSDAQCYPDTGWRWTYGPPRPDLAAKVQAELSQIGIPASVEARGFGEVDSCGDFSVYSVDFSIVVEAQPGIETLSQQDLAGRIQPIVGEVAEPRPGNIEITLLPAGETSTIHSSSADLPRREGPVSQSRSEQDPDWRQAITPDSPIGRYTHGFAYDTFRNVAVLFGGDDTGTSRLADTWEFDGENWHQVTPDQSPSGRVNIDQALVYDVNRKRIVLFGGLGSGDYLNDTWEYDGETWSQINTTSSPPKRDSHATAFDRKQAVTVLFGGYASGYPLNDTWEYDGSWQEVNPPQSPAARLHHSMAYDSSRDVVVLFGGIDDENTPLADTWEYDEDGWHYISPVQSPPARHNHSMAYNRARGAVVMFGGEGEEGLLSDTWEYDGSTWHLVETAHSPLVRTEMTLAYDERRSRLILFGGGYWDGDELTVFTETWEYGRSTPAPSGREFGRNVFVVVYDPMLSNGQKLSEYLNWHDHERLTQGTIDFFNWATGGRLDYNVAYTTILTDGWPEKIDGFQYTEEEYLAVIDGEIPAHDPDQVDYNKIVNLPELDICGKANRGEIDEVWIYNGPAFGFSESRLVGPDAYWYNSPPVPGPHDCERLIPIMGPSPERGLDCAVHNFGHRMESTMVRLYGSWQQNSTDHNWERFALVEALSPDYFYSGCGNIHYPPNGVRDYDDRNPSPTLSNCHDFANYPNLDDPAETVQLVDCSDWGCEGVGYLEYWFNHLPFNDSFAPDGFSNDWWNYFIDPSSVLEPEAGLSASPVSGVAPLSVAFTNASIGSYETCSWDFGDGNTSSDCSNPTHDYLSAGTYDVSLTISGLGGADTLTRYDYIDVYEKAQAGFSANPTSGAAPLSVSFTNTSAGDYETCLWDFGDSVASTDCDDPSHNYLTAGTYDVALTITGSGGSDTLTQTDYISVTSSPTFNVYLPLVTRPSQPSPAGWTAQDSGTTVFLKDLFFADDKHGWVVGHQGTILYTPDGGSTWTPQDSGGFSALEGIHCVNLLKCWAVGDGGRIIKTTNGGKHWNRLSSGTTSDLDNVFFVDEDTGWAVGYGGTILKTINGGENWDSQDSGTDFWLWGVHFLSQDIGWVSGGKGSGVILRTSDGGTTWSPASVADEIDDVYFVDTSRGWAATGAGSKILHTVDGGVSWMPITTSAPAAWLTGVYFVSPQEGWVTGAGGTILYTNDGGSTWDTQTSGISAILQSVYFPSPSVGWIVGEQGTILKYSD